MLTSPICLSEEVMDLTRTQRSLALRTVTTLSGSMRAADGSERPVTLRVQEGSGERL